jgi:enoyl-CoA hydratase/carnithine racemase
MYELVEIVRESGIATLKLNRPPVNALNFQLQAEIARASEELGNDIGVAAIVLYGGEKAFAAGADIKEMEKLSHDEMLARSAGLKSAFDAVAQIPKPVIAAVTGYALGGGLELAMCADVRIASESVKVGQPEILLGIIPGAGGTQRLTRLVGPSIAKELVFTGKVISATEAYQLGIINKVVADGEVYAKACEWARQFVGGPAVALATAKAAIDQGLDVSLDEGLEIERQGFVKLFATEDRAIGMASFLEHGPGKAKFVGR